MIILSLTLILKTTFKMFLTIHTQQQQFQLLKMKVQGTGQ